MTTSTFTPPELGYDTKQTDYPYEKKKATKTNKQKRKKEKQNKKEHKLWQGIQHRHLDKNDSD